MNTPSALSLIEPLLNDPEVSEILIDHHTRVYIEKRGVLHDVPSPFTAEAEVYALIDALAMPLGRLVDESHPYLSLRLEDNSLVTIVIPPIALNGPSITIRKHLSSRLTLADLLANDSLSAAMAEFLKVCVQARVNILVSGLTSAGKTQLLSVLGELIPANERVIIIEQAHEISLPHRHCVVLETRPPNVEGRGAVTQRDLLIVALNMRPDRVIMDDLSNGEAFDLATALSSGYDGALAAMHANNPRDAIERFEGLASTGNPSVPLLVVRERVSDAINLIVHLERLKDGSHKVVCISEVLDVAEGAIVLADLFQYQRTGFENGKVTGFFTATGAIPQFMPALQDAGFDSLPVEMFARVVKPTTQQRPWSASEIAALDYQLGDMVWFMATSLRAGYSMRQIFEHLAGQAPEPTASLWKNLLADLKNGFSFAESARNMLDAVPSTNLITIIATIQTQQQTGGNLAFMLEPVGETIWKKHGSDQAFAEAMRNLAKAVGADLPSQLKG